MTFDEIMLQCSANKKIKESEAKEKASFDYNLVQGIMFAFNDPKNMPKAEKLYPILDERTEEEKEIEKQSEINQDLQNFLKLSESIKKNK